jgi:hypothetical protein
MTRYLLIGLMMAVTAGCGGAETENADLIAPPGMTLPPTWQDTAGGYAFSCADQCAALNCNCIKNVCPPGAEGQVCPKAGATCNALTSKVFFEVLTCTPRQLVHSPQ